MDQKIVSDVGIKFHGPSAAIFMQWFTKVLFKRFNDVAQRRTGYSYRFEISAFYGLFYLIGKDGFVSRSSLADYFGLFYSKFASDEVVKFFMRRGILVASKRGKSERLELGVNAPLYIGVLLSVINDTYPELARMLFQHSDTELD